MSIARIYLYESGGHAICLNGDADAMKVVVDAIDLHASASGSTAPSSDETLNFAGDTFEINRTQLTRIFLGANGEEHFRLNISNLNLTLTANLLFAAGNKKFFGKNFSVDAGYSARLILRLTADALNLRPSATIEFCGSIEIDVGGGNVNISSEPLCFQVELERLLDGSGGNFPLPTLHIALPDFGFQLPKLSIPWSFPNLPSFPFALPSQLFPLDKLPIEVSWKSARISETGGKISADIVGLRIGGRLSALEGDLHLVWESGAIMISESYFDLYRPDHRNLLRLQFDQWHFDEDCLLVGWKKDQLNNWLKLIVPDIADTLESDADISLRVLSENRELSEIRLDWQPADSREIQLPGVVVTLPTETLFSFVFYRRGDNEKLAFVVTAKPTATDPKVITAKSTLAFNRSTSERELLKDPTSPLIKFDATPNKTVSVALLDFPLSGTDTVRFFRQLETPLEQLKLYDFQPPIPLPTEPGEEPSLDLPTLPTPCPPSDINLRGFRREDWSVALEIPSNLKFPFLQNGNSQFITIEPGTPTEVFPVFKCPFVVTVNVAGNLQVKSDIDALFDWETFAFGIDDKKGIDFYQKTLDTSDKDFLGLKWQFQPDPATKKLFTLVTAGKNYQLRQAKDSVISVKHPKVGTADEPLTFELRDFALTANGINAKGRVLPTPIKLGGLNTRFRFTEGEFTIEENRVRDFSIAGSGALPPKLVGEATADIALQFAVNEDESIEIVSGLARLRGKNLLDCKSTRFQFSVDGLGLKFVNDGRYHFYFTITGHAKFVPLPGDNSSGPLAWLPGIEMQMLDCPLTDDISVLSKHVKFLVEMPTKPTFDFVGCFKFELRGIGFVPQAPQFGGDAAMEISGQLMFADGAGDVVDVRVDFHNLFIGLPAPGDIFPRLHFKGLGVKVRVGDSFALEGEVDFFDDEEIEPGLIATGFAGRGSLTIQGLPTFTAAFSFIRVSRDGGKNHVRAWFVYVQAEKLSLRIPVINIFIREIGLGFGYRYTLASMKRADELDDPRELIKELRRMSLSQGELSRRDQWRVIVEEPGEDPRWTIAARLMIAQNSAASGIADWNQESEAEVPSLFLADAVLALRSDLTFLMTARAWLNTNYNDYRTKESLRTRPLMSGFVLLSPRQRRFLAHFASNPGAEFGDHPPTLPEFVKAAIRDSYFSATLLIEPGLLHYELGWANQLRWRGKLGPINAEFSGGMIFRISTEDVVYGQSFMARGSLELSAQAGGSSVGARISATAQVAYGARYIGVLGLVRPLERSALYGSIGIEINVRFSVEFWLRFKIGFVKISITLRFGFSVQLTVLLEIGFTPRNAIGARGRATVSLRIMGRGLHFKINVGVNHGAVEKALEITNRFLNIGLEGAEAAPIPGTTATGRNAYATPANDSGTNNGHPFNGPTPLVADLLLDNEEDESVPTDDAVITPHVFVAPNYSIYCIPTAHDESCFLIYPNEVQPAGENKQGFLPAPPEDGVDVNYDFEWTYPALGGDAELEHFNPITDEWEQVDSGLSIRWKAHWDEVMGSYEPEAKEGETPRTEDIGLVDLLRKAYIPIAGAQEFSEVKPGDDPVTIVITGESIEDDRVHNPSDAAFEAAVRGAAEQFEGSPYFKRDENSIYEAHLANAFLHDSTIYAEDGQNSNDAENSEQAMQLRSMIVSQMLTDMQRHVQGDSEFHAALSVAFQMGLVFRTKNGIPNWLLKIEKDGDGKQISVGSLKQRTKISSTDPDSAERTIHVFNTSSTNFVDCTPQFQRIRQYTDANTIAITWDLYWTEEIKDRLRSANHNDLQCEPEQFLNHYLIRRRALTGGERETEFSVKPVDVLTRPSLKLDQKVSPFVVSAVDKRVRCETGGFQIFERGREVKIRKTNGSIPVTVKIADTPDAVQPKQLTFDGDISQFENESVLIISGDSLLTLNSRFQFTDNFNDETLEDQVELSREGKSYLYTIIPVDVTGKHSLRPLTIMATRRANFPPTVPADSELKIGYKIVKEDFNSTSNSEVLKPERGKIVLEWSKPPDAAGQPRVVIDNYRLIFRKERTLPIGSYALDAESEGNRNEGLPSSNARALRTDIVVELEAKREENFKIQLNLQTDLIANGVFPKDDKWQPEAWRVFLQTESTSGVFSQLVPVKIVLQFNSDKQADKLKTVERQPALLEWIARPTDLRMLPPVDEKADVDFAAFPMPQLSELVGEAGIDATLQKVTMPGKDLATIKEGDRIFVSGASIPSNNGAKTVISVSGESVTFAAGSFGADETSKLTLSFDALSGDLKRLLSFQKHPDDLRAVRLRWNQGPSGRPEYQSNLQAGYQIREFDLDAHTSEILNNPPAEFLEKLRRVQDVELLSAASVTVTPDNAAVANQWEAWYPSAVRRRRLRLEAQNIANVPPKFSNARVSPWFSWRDSYLEWVGDEFSDSTAQNVLAFQSRKIKILEAEQGTGSEAELALILEAGEVGWAGYTPGDFVRVVGAKNPANNGLKQISRNQRPSDTEKLVFVAGSFVKDERAQRITLDLRPKTVLHPFLQKLKKELDSDTLSVEINPLPSIKLDDLDLLQKQLSPQQDPYGWNILKLMGLGVTIMLRNRQTGEVLAPKDAQGALRETLNKLRTKGILYPTIERHLFIEFLFQPGKSTRLESEEFAPDENDLLSLMQISLRPVARRYFRYWVYRTKTAETVKLKLNRRSRCEIVELTRDASRAMLENNDEVDKEFSFKPVLPAGGEAILLIRGVRKPTVNENDPTKPALKEFSPTDWLSLNFDARPDDWRAIFDESANWAERADKPAVAWQQLGAYLGRLNAVDDTAKIDPPTDPVKVDATLAWLNRFFDAGGDMVSEPGSAIADHTGSQGGSIAAAYVCVPSPASLTPDTAGRLTYHHRVEDQWAHVYRYYFLPQNRYDRLWLALAQSDVLFNKPKPETNLWFKPPEPESGGLDVVLDRIKEVSAPLILYSGRLDQSLPDAQIPKPGKTWEVVVAKHPEQSLIERNQTLFRQLDFRQTAHTMVRRFAFLEELKALKRELVAQGNSVLDQLEYTSAVVDRPLPGPVQIPDRLEIEKLDQLETNDRLSLDLPSRLGVFSKDAIALQYEALPFFYEHKLMIVAQTSTQVSSITSVVQRDFEYLSPSKRVGNKPRAECEAIDLPNGERTLQVRITLANYWSCLPPDVRDRWPEENPQSGNNLKFGTMPDTGVAYQIVLAAAVAKKDEQDPFINIGALTELYFDSSNAGTLPPATHFKARKFGTEFEATPVRVDAPNAFSPHMEFALLVKLNKTNRLKLPHHQQEIIVFGDMELEDFIRILRDELGEGLNKLIATEADPDEIKYVVRHNLAVATMSMNIDLPQELHGKAMFVRRNAEDLLTAQTYLSKAECDLLLTLFTNPGDRAAAEKFCRDLDDRQTLEELFRDWISEQAIGSRHDFGAETARIEFPAPMLCVLTLDVEQADRDETLQALYDLLETDRDNSFNGAVHQLIQQLEIADETRSFFRADACVGLEQIREMASDAVFTLDEQHRKVRWRGAMRPVQLDALERWSKISDFNQTFRQLLIAGRGEILRFKFVKPDPLPGNWPIPSILNRRMTVEESAEKGFMEIVWKGLQLNFDEERAVLALPSTIFGEAATQLRASLTGTEPAALHEIEVGIVEAFWRLRPTAATLPLALRSRLLIGNGNMRSYGWITRDEARALIDLQAEGSPNRKAVRRLFRDALRLGLRGSKLHISARRGSAEVTKLEAIESAGLGTAV